MTGNGRFQTQRPPDEIQAEIDRTRGELDRTLSALEQRLTPGQLIDQAYGYLRRSGAREYFEHLGASARRDPLPLAFVGIGMAWLMLSDRRHSAEPADETSGETSGASALRERMSNTAHRVADSAHSVRGAAAQAAQTARAQAERVHGGYRRMVEEQPLTLGAVGLALGALLGGATAGGSSADDEGTSVAKASPFAWPPGSAAKGDPSDDAGARTADESAVTRDDTAG